MLDTIKIIKDFGVLAICLYAMVWLNSRLTIQEQKTERIEDKLYDCFEDRIKENSFKFPNTSDKDQTVVYYRPYAILPNEIKIKKDESKS